MDDYNTIKEQLAVQTILLQDTKLQVKRIQLAIDELKVKLSRCTKPPTRHSQRHSTISTGPGTVAIINNLNEPFASNVSNVSNASNAANDGETKRSPGRPRLNPDQLAPSTKAVYARMERLEQKKQVKVKSRCQKFREDWDPLFARNYQELKSYLNGHTREEAIEFFKNDLRCAQLRWRKEEASDKFGLLGGVHPITREPLITKLEALEWVEYAKFVDEVIKGFAELLSMTVPELCSVAKIPDVAIPNIDLEEAEIEEAMLSLNKRKEAPLAKHHPEARGLSAAERITFYSVMGLSNPDDEYAE